MAFLPKSVVLKSSISQRYLRYISKEDDARWSQFVKFDAENIWSPNVKFIVERASVGDGAYVHLRSAYNKKYLKRSDDSPESWIMADGDKKEEDTSEWSCTLFEPVRINPTDGIKLRHVQLGYFTQMHYISGEQDDFKFCMFTPFETTNFLDDYTFIDSASLVPLPRFVAFKGDNGNYLRPNMELNGFMQFVSKDKGEIGVAHEIVPTNDGNYQIKMYGGEDNLTWEALAFEYDEFGQWVCATAAASQESWEDNRGSLFQAVKVGDNVIALKNVALNQFCRRSEPSDSPLNAFVDGLLVKGTTITEAAQLELEEAVLRRTLTVQFHTEEAQTYDSVLTTKQTIYQDNNEDEEATQTLTIECTDDVTTTWESTDSWTVGVTTSIEVDVIPLVASASVTLSAEYAHSYTWGESTTKGKTITDTNTYTVKPHHRITVELIGLEGTCDVPFSYVQTDYLVNGDIISTTKSDGVYKGVNCSEYHVKDHQDPLP